MKALTKFLISAFLILNVVLVLRQTSTFQSSNNRRRLETTQQKLCKDVDWDQPLDDFLNSYQKDAKSRVDNGIKMYRSDNELEKIARDVDDIEDSKLEDYFKDLAIIAIPFMLFGIISLIMWLVLCICVCCHNRDKNHYSKLQKRIYFILVIVLLVGIASSSIAGLAITKKITDGVKYATCSVASIVTEVLEGKGQWSGLDKWISSLNRLETGDFTEQRMALQDLSDANQQSISQFAYGANGFINDENDQASKLISENQITFAEGIRVLKEEGLEATDGQSFDLSDDLVDVRNFQSEISTNKADFDDMSDDVQKIVEDYIELVLNIFWGFILALSILGIVCSIFMLAQKKAIRYFFNISWCCFNFIMIFTFLIGGLFITFDIILYEACDIFEKVISDKDEFNAYPSIFKDDVRDKLEVCMFEKNSANVPKGDLGQLIIGDSNEQYNSLKNTTQKIEELENLDYPQTAIYLKTKTEQKYVNALGYVQQADELIAVEQPKVANIKKKFADYLLLAHVDCSFFSESSQKLIASVCTVFLVPLYEIMVVLLVASFFMFFCTIFSYKYSIMVGSTSKNKYKK